jgi:predicted ATPase
MIKSISVTDFKGFHQATLKLGPLTLLVGANASGKSNLRDAFRVLHGIGRGYTVAEILGEKWGEGGVLQWRGIRGGTREATFQRAKAFSIEVTMALPHGQKSHDATYRVEIEAGLNGKPPRVAAEHLIVQGQGTFVFDSRSEKQYDSPHLFVHVRKPGRGRNPTSLFLRQQPILSQFADQRHLPLSGRELARSVLDVLGNMRFLDLNPEAMRRPSLPGQTVLGDQGENLSSVLQQITQQPDTKQALLQWVKALTPMDAIDFEFPNDATGRIVVTLVETKEQRTTVNSASDGTLRFLTMIAALLGPEPAGFYFFEELDNGIHPARLHLLLQLIEQQVTKGTTQMVATTHSPQLLRLLSREMLDYAALTYRLPDEASAHVARILDIPEAARVIEQQDLARLHESGWLEDAVAFTESVGIAQ